MLLLHLILLRTSLYLVSIYEHLADELEIIDSSKNQSSDSKTFSTIGSKERLNVRIQRLYDYRKKSLDKFKRISDEKKEEEMKKCTFSPKLIPYKSKSPTVILLSYIDSQKEESCTFFHRKGIE